MKYILRHITDAWCRETSADPDNWTKDNPAWGQCAVTALAVQDELGGQLLRARVSGVSHYWNLLPDGRHLDLTLRQFRDIFRLTYEPDAQGEIRERAYVLSFAETASRYELLRERASAGCIGGAQPEDPA